MARRSVVLQSPEAPAAPRRTVVLRPGGPAPKGRVLDVVIGVVGALLLIIAVALAQVLPDRTYLNPQFRLSFVDQGREIPTSTTPGPLTEDGTPTHVFTFQIDEANVQAITMTVGFADDHPYSEPDRFRLELLDPAGNLVGTHRDVENPRPLPVPADGLNPPTFEPQRASERFTFEVVPHPSEQVVPGLSHLETAEQALAREEPKYRVANNGVWSLRVTLVDAGDCPDPAANQQRALYCQAGNPQQPDTVQGREPGTPDIGNLFTVEILQYTWYTPVIEEL